MANLRIGNTANTVLVQRYFPLSEADCLKLQVAKSRLFNVATALGAFRGRDFFTVACQYDLEGIVCKWPNARYCCDGLRTTWVKIKNPQYTQIAGRRELFESLERRPTRRIYRPQLAIVRDTIGTRP